MSKWTLEQEELIAVNETTGFPVLKQVAVQADAGSGKTSVLVERIKRILKVKTDPILCVSFTEKSAKDLKERLEDFDSVEVYTIHGFCLKILKENSFKLGIDTLSQVADEKTSNDIFNESFIKVSRRIPPKNADFSWDQWQSLCLKVLKSENRDEFQYPNTEVEKFIKAVIESYEGAKKQKKLLEYSDLETLALKALFIPELSYKYRKKYRHIFVDEFQDTSELQCDLIKKLSSPEQSLFVVGDSKQSIYRFRGADVAVFERFVAELPEKRRLSSNFRSIQKVIDAVNIVSEETIPDYGPMNAFRKEPKKDRTLKNKAVAKIHLMEKASNESTKIVETIYELKEKGVSLSEMVLLLTRIRGKEDLLQEIQKNGIGVAIGSSSAAESNQSLQSLLRLWVYACEPWNRLYAEEAQVAFGTKREDLIQSKATHSIYTDSLSAVDLLEVLNQEYSLEKNLGICYLQFKLFIYSLHERAFSPLKISREIIHALLKNQEIQGLAVLPPPDNLQGALRVLTVHASKGLEFPVVLLGDLHRAPRSDKNPFVIKNKKILLSERLPNGKLAKSEEIDEIKQEEKREQILESARLLYVAMTRAEDSLYAFIDPTVIQEKKYDNTWAKWLSLLPEQVETSPLKEKEVSILEKETFYEPLFTTDPIYTKARVGVTEFIQQKVLTRPTIISNMKALRNAKEASALGTMLHGFLEKEDWNGFWNYAEEQKLDLSHFKNWLETSEEAKRIFHSPVKAINEFPFELEAPTGEVLTGRMDRLILDPTKKEAFIVDYKFLFSKKSEEELKKHYAEQLEIYRDAVCKITGYKNTKAYVLDVLAVTNKICHCILG